MTATDIRLTGRQSQVLELIGQGMTAKEIGARLGITARTVKFHSDILRRKYQVQNVRQLIRMAPVDTNERPELRIADDGIGV